MRHRPALAAALISAAALGVLGLPAAAQAASGITIVSAGNPAGQPSVLNVVADDTLSTGITSMTAQLTPIGGGTAYAPPALALSAGTDTSGTWSTTIPSGAIAAGDYTISVTATDADGPDTNADAGTLGYLYQPTLTAATNVGSVTYGNETVVFSGQLTAVPPGGGTPVNEASVPVYYSLGGGSPILLATTQSDGTYSATVSNVTGGSWVMTTNATSTVAAAESTEVSVSGIQEQVSLTGLVVSPAHLKYGETATLTGQVTVPGGASDAGIPVQVTDGTATLPAVATDGTGDFTATFPTSDGENLQVTAAANVPLLVPALTNLSVSVPAPLHTRLFTAKLQGDGILASGICILTDPTNFSPFEDSWVQLQYAAKKSGPWRNLGRLPANEIYAPANCQGGGWTYYTNKQAPFGARLLSAYYRVSIRGNAAIEPYTSPVAHSSIGRSRIASFAVNQTSVSQGSRLTFTGELQRRSGRRWLGYGHERVYLELVKHGRLLGYVVYARTSGSGRFRLSFIAGSPRSRFVFAAFFDGSSKYLWSLSKDITVAFNGGATPRGAQAGSLVLGKNGQLGASPGQFIPVQ
jgi:hypothetical protein